MTDNNITIPAWEAFVNTDPATIDDLSDQEWKALAKADAFNRDDDHPMALALREPERILRFLRILRSLAFDVSEQIQRYQEDMEEGSRDSDEDWLLRAKRLRRAVDFRVSDVKALAQERGVLSQPSPAMERWYRYLISTHRDNILRDEDEPSDHDEALWSAALD